MNRILLPAKRAGDVVNVSFSFLSLLAVGETISTAGSNAYVYSGVDPTPTAILSGAPTISGPNIVQTITGGVQGVIYVVYCKAVTSTGQSLILAGYQAVIQDLP